MSNKNRARTRAVRAEMAQTGDSYTRAAARASTATPPQNAGSGIDAVREHACRVLQAASSENQTRLRHAEELERAGHRIVGGGQTGPDSWTIYDWRTNQLLAEGATGIEGYDAVAERLDPDDRWFHCDHLWDDVPLTDVETPGVPPSLGRAIEDWLGSTGTPDAEIAEFVGWSVDDVRARRKEGPG